MTRPKYIQNKKQEGQEALNHSPEFYLKLTCRYLLKDDHVPGDTTCRTNFGPRAYFEKLGRGPLGDATHQTSRL